MVSPVSAAAAMTEASRGMGLAAAPPVAALCAGVAPASGAALPPADQPPRALETSWVLGSKPLFSAFLLGRLMGLGTAMMGPVLRAGPPRTGGDEEVLVCVQHRTTRGS